MRFLAGASLLFLLLRQASAADKPDVESHLASYSPGDSIPIECLNRTIDTGEHIQDSKTGKLQYIPFALCNETQSPLQLRYLGGEVDDGGNSWGLNCTIAAVSDPMYHLLEFYIHHDSPMSCRIRARPGGNEGEIVTADVDSGSGGAEWVPLIFAITGKMESSHLHISPDINLLLHLSSPGVIDSAAAYSTSALTSALRIAIGDTLPLRFRVRWYPSTDLPVGGLKVSGYGAGHTLLYCILSALVGAVGCYAWVVGVDVPRRLRRVTTRMRKRDSSSSGGIIGNFPAGEKRGYGYGFPAGGLGSIVGGSGSGGAGGGGYGYGAKRND